MMLGRYFGLVKFEHTIFALPFALMSLLVATGGQPESGTLLWVVVAMVGARSAAMAFSRLADRRIDARNPRTADRHIPTGAVSPLGAVVFTVISAAVLVLAARQLNSLCYILSPVALVVVLGYSVTKRFTPWSHLVLGLGLAVAPVGGWLAATGTFAPFPLWLAAGVMFWVGGFDVIYGCQDVDFDRREGLHSLPVHFDVAGALRIARVLHVLAVICVAAAMWVGPELGFVSLIGAAVMALLLLQEHRLVRGGNLTHIDKAFFTINSWIGMLVLVCVLIDLYLI